MVPDKYMQFSHAHRQCFFRTIEVRIVHKGEDVFMSLKDDCKPFNPKDRAELVNPQDDSTKSISIRVFMGIVKETDYQLTLGINVFTVTI